MKITKLLLAVLLLVTKVEGVDFTKSVDNIAEMQQQNVHDIHDAVFVKGYRIKGDGGGGLFYLTNSVSGKNTGTKIQSSNDTIYSWMRVFDGNVNPKWFGAYGDGIHSDFTPLQAAMAFCGTNGYKLSLNGTFLIDTNLIITTDNFSMEGVSRNNGIKATNGLEYGIFVSGKTNISLSNFILDGSSNVCRGIYMTNVSQATLKDMLVGNFNKQSTAYTASVGMDGVDGVLIDNCNFFNTGVNSTNYQADYVIISGFYTANRFNKNIRIVNSTINNRYSKFGIALFDTAGSGAAYTKVDMNFQSTSPATNNGYSFMSYAHVGTVNTDNYFDNCLATNVNGTAFYVENAIRNRIAHSTAVNFGMTQSPFSLPVGGAVINNSFGCIVEDFMATNTPQSGIVVCNSTNVTVNSSRTWATATSGIELRGVTKGLLIFGNLINTASLAGIGSTLNGNDLEDSSIFDNRIFNCANGLYQYSGNNNIWKGNITTVSTNIGSLFISGTNITYMDNINIGPGNVGAQLTITNSVSKNNVFSGFNTGVQFLGTGIKSRNDFFLANSTPIVDTGNNFYATITNGGTIDVSIAEFYYINSTTTDTITNLTGASPGEVRTFVSQSTNTTFQHNGNLNMQGGASWTPGSFDETVMQLDNNSRWHERSKKVNALISPFYDRVNNRVTYGNVTPGVGPRYSWYGGQSVMAGDPSTSTFTHDVTTSSKLDGALIAREGVTGFSQGRTTVQESSTNMLYEFYDGRLFIHGTTNDRLSSAGNATIDVDKVTGQIYVSQNGGPRLPLATVGGGGSEVWTNDAALFSIYPLDNSPPVQVDSSFHIGTNNIGSGYITASANHSGSKASISVTADNNLDQIYILADPTFDAFGTGILVNENSVATMQLIPNQLDGFTPYVLDTSIPHSSGNLLEVNNNATNKLTLSPLGNLDTYSKSSIAKMTINLQRPGSQSFGEYSVKSLDSASANIEVGNLLFAPNNFSGSVFQSGTPASYGSYFAVNLIKDGSTAVALQDFSSGDTVFWPTTTPNPTAATNGFFYLPSTTGTPTGVPFLGTTGFGAYTNTAMIVDRVNHLIWYYSGGTWRTPGSGSSTVGTNTTFSDQFTVTYTGGTNQTVAFGPNANSTNNTFVGSITMPFYTVPGTVIDGSQGNRQKQTVGANRTYTFSNMTEGRPVQFTLSLTTTNTISFTGVDHWEPVDAAPSITLPTTNTFVFETRNGSLWGSPGGGTLSIAGGGTGTNFLGSVGSGLIPFVGSVGLETDTNFFMYNKASQYLWLQRNSANVAQGYYQAIINDAGGVNASLQLYANGFEVLNTNGFLYLPSSRTFGVLVDGGSLGNIYTNTSTSPIFQFDGITNTVVGAGNTTASRTNDMLVQPTFSTVPTGTPKTYTGRVNTAINTDNNHGYVYNGGVWNDAGASRIINAQNGTSYAILLSDGGKLVTHTNASATADTIAQAGSAGFPNGWTTTVKNEGAGAVTITPSSCNIDGLARLFILQGEAQTIQSDGANYHIFPGVPSIRTLFTSAATVQFSNTAAATSLFGAASRGSLTLPANFLTVGKRIHLNIRGYLINSGTPSTQIQWKFGSTVVEDTGARAGVSTAAWRGWVLDGTVICQSVGASGVVSAGGTWTTFFGSSSATLEDFPDPTQPTSNTTVDTTAAQTMDCLFTYGTANNANRIYVVSSTITCEF